MVLLATLSGVASATNAQVPQLTPGTRLRVTLAQPSPLIRIARFEALPDTSLILSSDGSQLTVPFVNISLLEVSRGRRPSVAGAVVGMVIGAAAGGALACAANRDDYGVFCAGQNDTKVAVGAGFGALAGATLGAVLLRKEKWSELKSWQSR